MGKLKFQTAMLTYPLHNNAYRDTLNDNIYNYYKHYRLSIYNVDKWLDLLSARMAVIMPKYNLLYKSLDYLTDLDPLLNYDKQRTLDHAGENGHNKEMGTKESTTSNYDSENTGSATTTGEAHGTGSDTSRYSDAPQGNMASPPNSNDMGFYVTNATYNSNKDDTTSEQYNMHSDKQGSTGSGSLERNAKEEYSGTDSYKDTEHEWGTSPNSNYSKMLADYRALAIDIDMQIIKELDDLFFTTFSPSDFMESIETVDIGLNPFINFINPWHPW